MLLLAHLLRNPQIAFSAGELLDAVGGSPQLSPSESEFATELVAGPAPSSPDSDDGADYAIDKEAHRDLQQNLRELAQEREAAERIGDVDSANRIAAQVEQIEEYLRLGGALGGRRRRLSDDRNKLRNRVYRLISTARKKIGRCHPALAAHLRASIKTGYSPRYLPAQELSWKF
jgi:hypothetical protein